MLLAVEPAGQTFAASSTPVTEQNANTGLFICEDEVRDRNVPQSISGAFGVRNRVYYVL